MIVLDSDYDLADPPRAWPDELAHHGDLRLTFGEGRWVSYICDTCGWGRTIVYAGMDPEQAAAMSSRLLADRPCSRT